MSNRTREGHDPITDDCVSCDCRDRNRTMRQDIYAVVGYCEHENSPFLAAIAFSEEDAIKMLIEAAQEHHENLGHETNDLAATQASLNAIACRECADEWAVDMRSVQIIDDAINAAIGRAVVKP